MEEGNKGPLHDIKKIRKKIKHFEKVSSALFPTFFVNVNYTLLVTCRPTTRTFGSTVKNGSELANTFGRETNKIYLHLLHFWLRN